MTINRRHLGVSLLALASLGPASRPAWATAPVLSIPGAGPPEAGLRALAAEFAKADGGSAVDIPKSIGIAGGLRMLNAGDADLVRLARRLSDEELRAGGFSQLVYAMDAVVFAGGRDVPVDNLTEAQALGLFSGKIDDWDALGGKPAPVLTFYREPSEIAHQGIKRQLPAFASLSFGPMAKLASSDNDMVEGLTRYRQALGWLPLSAVRASGGQIKALAFNGVAASPDTLASGRYRLAIEHVLVYRDARLSSMARRFLGFVRSDAGMRVLRGLNLLPLRAAAA
jgi:phosphate transport system substrate-binding protein